MITKERLEELIKQGATIWIFNKVDGVYSVNLSLLGGYMFSEYCVITENDGVLILDHTYETKEEAEWHREFGCIERTERLELPTYEWMQPKESEQDVYYNFYNYNHELMGIRVTKQSIALYKSYRCSDLTSTVDIFDNTKENYTLACRKAKELFLGD